MRGKTTKFTLTEDHIKLLRMMYVQWQDDETGAPEIDPKRPYGNSDVAGDVHEILTGEEGAYLTAARRTECLALHRGTAVALQIVLAVGTFEPGEFELLEEYDARSWRRVL